MPTRLWLAGSREDCKVPRFGHRILGVEFKTGEGMLASIAIAVVKSTTEPVFAVRLSGEIVAWNDSADRLFGFSSEQMTGKPCYKFLQGRDAFGNSYCVERCPVRIMAQQLKRLSRFELVYRNDAGSDVPVAIWPLVMPKTDGEEALLVHLIQPLKLAGLVSDCGEIDDHQAAADDLVHRLTPRQIEVLRLLATGLSTHAIAEHLFISELTVRNHVENLLHKLEVHSRLEAVSMAHHSGLV